MYKSLIFFDPTYPTSLYIVTLSFIILKRANNLVLELVERVELMRSLLKPFFTFFGRIFNTLTSLKRECRAYY